MTNTTDGHAHDAFLFAYMQKIYINVEYVNFVELCVAELKYSFAVLLLFSNLHLGIFNLFGVMY